MISEPILGIIMLCLMIFAIFIGFPVAFTLMALGVLFGFPSMGWTVFDLMVQRSFAVMNNDVLVSLPLFMLMGYVMERAGIMDRMFHSYRLLFGPLPGAIALATMFVGTIFGIASGIVGAGVTLMGVLALPPMLRAGYSVELAAGTITRETPKAPRFSGHGEAEGLSTSQGMFSDWSRPAMIQRSRRGGS